jgi:hypothetical protein
MGTNPNKPYQARLVSSWGEGRGLERGRGGFHFFYYLFDYQHINFSRPLSMETTPTPFLFYQHPPEMTSFFKMLSQIL